MNPKGPRPANSPPLVSFPRKRESSKPEKIWIPAYAGMTMSA